MTAQDDLDPGLETYLDSRARRSMRAGLLDDALRAARTTRQRPGWAVAEWWLGYRAASHIKVATRVLAAVATLAFLVAAVVALVVIAGSQRRLPPPFGLARPGLIAVVSSGHVFTMNADGTGRKQLTSGQGSDYRPTWSRDGTRIAYLSTEVVCPKDSCLNETSALKVIDTDGGRPITIADGLAASSVGEIAWSPDSRRLAYAAVPAGALLSLSRLYVAEADGSAVHQIGDAGMGGFEPAWSPDGTQLAFTRMVPKPGLWLIRPDGSDAHPLTTAPGSGWAFWNAQWSPDGSQLVFLGGDDGAHSVWVIDADGSSERQLVKPETDIWWPTWSPDGSRIAFVEMVGAVQRGRVVVVKKDGSDSVALDGPGVDGSMPVWSPDGTKLFGFLSETANCTHCQYTFHNPIHQGLAVYDVAGRTPPTILVAAEDGTWQRLAP